MTLFDETLQKHRDECDQGLRDGTLLARLTALYDETVIGSPERIKVDDALGDAIFAIQRLMDRIGVLEGIVIPSENAFHALTLSNRANNQGHIDFDTVDLSEEDYNAIWMRHIKPEVCKNAVSDAV